MKLPKQALTCATAVFVKTPGLSPIKTRLSKTIGEGAALNLYKLSCRIIVETVLYVGHRTGGRLSGYLAVAENEALDQWQDLPRICQGDGCLGARLAKVYEELFVEHDAVILIGSDAPQLSADHLLKVYERFAIEQGPDFMIGPARDGGFYLFAGRKPLPNSFWHSQAYSQADTLTSLINNLEKLSDRIEILEALTDLDHREDLMEVSVELARLNPPTSLQTEMIRCMRLLVD